MIADRANRGMLSWHGQHAAPQRLRSTFLDSCNDTVLSPRREKQQGTPLCRGKGAKIARDLSHAPLCVRLGASRRAHARGSTTARIVPGGSVARRPRNAPGAKREEGRPGRAGPTNETPFHGRRLDQPRALGPRRPPRLTACKPTRQYSDRKRSAALCPAPSPPPRELGLRCGDGGAARKRATRQGQVAQDDVSPYAPRAAPRSGSGRATAPYFCSSAAFCSSTSFGVGSGCDSSCGPGGALACMHWVVGSVDALAARQASTLRLRGDGRAFRKYALHVWANIGQSWPNLGFIRPNSRRV